MFRVWSNQILPKVLTQNIAIIITHFHIHFKWILDFIDMFEANKAVTEPINGGSGYYAAFLKNSLQNQFNWLHHPFHIDIWQRDKWFVGNEMNEIMRSIEIFIGHRELMAHPYTSYWSECNMRICKYFLWMTRNESILKPIDVLWWKQYKAAIDKRIKKPWKCFVLPSEIAHFK